MERKNRMEPGRIDRRPSHLEQETQDIVAGRNAVLELLLSDTAVDSVWVEKGEKQGSLLKILAICREKGIVVKEVSPVKIEGMSGIRNHQGVAAVIAAHAYASVEEILSRAELAGVPPFLVICADIEDPHNLGAIIRTAECAGAHGVIIPKRHSASLTSAVYKTSAGALRYLPVARVSNLAQEIEGLKKRGIWIYGADMAGEDYRERDYRGATALVIGNEGRGIPRLVREKCDFIVSLPLHGKISSLNASVAAGILMYEVARQR